MQIIFSGPLDSLILFRLTLKIKSGARKRGPCVQFITSHGQTQLNRLYYFRFFGVSLVSKAFTIQNLRIFTAAGVVL